MPNSRDVIEELSNEVVALRRDFAEMLENLKERGEDQLATARRTARTAAKRVRGAAETAVHRGEELAEEAGHALANRPVVSTFAALGIGLLVGSIIHAMWRGR